jgi:hypothetical protein
LAFRMIRRLDPYSMDCQLSGACPELVVALARHNVHESERRPSRDAAHISVAIFYVLCTVHSRISVRQRTIIIQWHDYLRVWRLRFVTASAMWHNTYCSRPGMIASHHDDQRRPWAWIASSGTDNDGCEGPVKRLSTELPNYRLGG